jgi:hypothetical protein
MIGEKLTAKTLTIHDSLAIDAIETIDTIDHPAYSSKRTFREGKHSGN